MFQDMFQIMKYVSYALILISAVFKGIALWQLSNKKRDFAVSRKKYTQMNIVCYLFLLPGVLLFIYSAILH